LAGLNGHCFVQISKVMSYDGQLRISLCLQTEHLLQPDQYIGLSGLERVVERNKKVMSDGVHA
jgi:hypothetical protein